MSSYSVISADSHINEPPDLWTTRVQAKYRDRAPRVERFDQGDAWVIEGALDPINFGGNCSAGLPLEVRSPWIRADEMRPGGYLPAPRIEDQDQDGVDAEVLYPTPRIGNSLFWNRDDKEFHVDCIRAYNDWLSEFCSHDPDRLWGVAMVPNAGVESAVAEFERATSLPGIRGAMIGQYPHGGEVMDASDDPLWASAAERKVPISIHVSFATQAQGDKKRMKLTGDMRFFDVPVRASQFINGAVFDRFPDLTLVLVEVDSGWIPYLREQMTDRFLRQSPEDQKRLARKPDEYFDTNIASTFITDEYGVANRHRVGLTQMMWSSDFPHGGSDWPKSKASIESQTAGVPDDEKHLLIAGNAARLYGVG
ncbi:MAG: amidohydrolase family protein [Ilumatobacteraceae bacterium]|nr:amidohydrolase family protein [Ilumatobacteraceae bacterium]